MAKSLRSKRKRKLRAIKRERLRVKEKKRLEVVLGVKGKDKEIERYRPDGSRIPVAEEVEAMEEDSANVENTNERNEGLQNVASTQGLLYSSKVKNVLNISFLRNYMVSFEGFRYSESFYHHSKIFPSWLPTGRFISLKMICHHGKCLYKLWLFHENG